MDIMKKYILIIITIVLIIVAIISYKVYTYNTMQKNLANNNKTYSVFYEKNVLGTDVATLINKAIDKLKFYLKHQYFL